jgi:hypothetical protein
MGDGVMKIVKVGQEPASAPAKPAIPQTTGGKKRDHSRKPKFGILKHGRTARSKPRFEAVRDPAKSPPVRKSTLRILTEKGAKSRLKSIRKTVRSMPDQKVRAVLKSAGIRLGPNTPEPLARDILEGGMEAGMIVAN